MAVTFAQHHIALHKAMVECEACTITTNIVYSGGWRLSGRLNNPGGSIWVRGRLSSVGKEEIAVGGCLKRAHPANRVDAVFCDDFPQALKYLHVLLKNEPRDEDDDDDYPEGFGFYE